MKLLPLLLGILTLVQPVHRDDIDTVDSASCCFPTTTLSSSSSLSLSTSIDIDILFYSDEIVNQKDLIIPHQRLHLRNFVLYPLNDIAADFIHPILLKSVNKLLNECEDNDTPKVLLLGLS